MNYHLDKQETLWALTNSTQYKGEVFTSEFPESNWKKFPIESDVPLRIIKANEQKMAIAGDNATLFIVNEQKSWQLIQAPFSKHITALEWLGDSLIVGVRNEGVYVFYEQQWQKLNISKTPQFDIIHFWQSHEGGGKNMHFLSTIGECYRFNHAENEFQSCMELSFLESPSLSSHVALTLDKTQILAAETKLWLVENHKAEAVRIPQAAQLQAVALTHTGKLWVSDAESRVLLQITPQKTYFVENVSENELLHVPAVKQLFLAELNLMNTSQKDYLFFGNKISSQVHVYTQLETGKFVDNTGSVWPEIPHKMDFLLPVDLDNDGDDDLITAKEYPDKVVFSSYHNFKSQLNLRETVQLVTRDYKSLRDIVLYDWDANGYTDILALFHYSDGLEAGYLTVFENHLGHIFHSYPTRISETMGWNNEVHISDINNDGYEDVYLANSWRNDRIAYGPDWKNGQFSWVDLPEKSNTYQAVWANLDDNPELELIRFTSASQYAVLTQRDHQFVPLEQFGEFLEDYTKPVSFSLADLNRDGSLDIILESFESIPIKIGFNEKNRFAERRKVFDSELLKTQTAFPIDIDADSDIDLLVASGSETVFYENLSQVQESANLKRMATKRLAFFQNEPKQSNKLSWLFAQILYIVSIPVYYGYLIEFFGVSVILLLSIQLGRNRYNWSFQSSLSLVIINMSLFWMALVLTASSGSIFSFFIPGLISVATSLVPVAISENAHHSTKRQFTRAGKEELLMLLMRYTHGAWSSSLMNRLIMLAKNKNDLNEDFKQHLTTRLEQFKSIMIPELKTIMELTNQSELWVDALPTVKEDLVELEQINATKVFSSTEEFLNRLTRLKNAIKDIRMQVWFEHSSQIDDVIQSLIMDWQKRSKIQQIELIYEFIGDKQARVLIPGAILSSVVDNLCANAFEALKRAPAQNAPQIHILVFKKAPKWLIQVTDNGCGIKPEIQKSVFEPGFSDFGSTGQGLSQAKKDVAHYGGRIFLQESNPEKRTTFAIELLEIDS